MQCSTKIFEDIYGKKEETDLACRGNSKCSKSNLKPPCCLKIPTLWEQEAYPIFFFFCIQMTAIWKLIDQAQCNAEGHKLCRQAVGFESPSSGSTNCGQYLPPKAAMRIKELIIVKCLELCLAYRWYDMCVFKIIIVGVPIMVQRKQMRLGTMRFWVRSLASHSGLRMQRCYELWCRSQSRLGSSVAVAVA